MSKFSRIYDFNIEINGVFTLDVEGTYMRIMSSTGAVEVVTDSYRLGPIRAGQGQQDAPYRRLTIINKSGAANSGTILVASSGFIDQRISGEISIVEKEKSAAIDKVLYSASIYIPGAASKSVGQLYNPVGSGKLLCMTRLAVNPSTSANFSVVGSNVQLATLLTAISCNHFIGEPLGTGQTRRENLPEYPAYSGVLWTAFAAGNFEAKWDITGEIVIPPGKSVTCFSAVNNVGMVMNISWYERDAP